jgi:hypothetical protein
MHLQRLFHQGQSHPAPFYFVAWPQGLEHLKDAVMICPGDAWPVIAHSKLDKRLCLLAGDGDMTGGAVVVLDGIPEQIAEDQLQRDGRCVERWQRRHNSNGKSRRNIQEVQRLSDQITGIDTVRLASGAANARVLEQAGKEIVHALDPLLQQGQMTACRLR